MNKDLRNLLLGGSMLAGAGLLLAGPVLVDMGPALAQTATAPGGVTTVQQSAARADAASFYAGNTRTSCSTSQDSVANLTITVTPPSGNFVYLTGVYFEMSPNATGASSATVWSSTNLTGNPAWLTNVTTAAAANPSSEILVSEVYPTGLKSTAAGTAVTIVPNATTASAFACVHVVGYYSPL